MELLHGWENRLKQADNEGEKGPRLRHVPKANRYYEKKIQFVQTKDEAEGMAELIQQVALSHIGFDTEFQYERPGVPIDSKNTAEDPRSIRPLLLSLAAAEPISEVESRLYRFVVDIECIETHGALEEVFRLPVVFCGHFLKVEFFCLWKLGLTEPTLLWDTFTCEKALQLGVNRNSNRLSPWKDVVDEIMAKREKEANEHFGLSLVATCQRYGVPFAMAGDKDRLRRSFIEHRQGKGFTDEQVRYSAQDAVAAAQVYMFQQGRALREGMIHHLVSVEMPWVATNARIEWNGVRIDEARRDRTKTALAEIKITLGEQIANRFGIGNYDSHPQLKEFFSGAGLLHHFRLNGKVSFDRELMKRHRHLHPAIPLIRAARRAGDLQADKIMWPKLIGSDGRIHPQHRQLGADTGRQTSRWPNLLGLDGMLRPLVVPEEGCGIGEVDWSQVEVGVAAAVYRDENLVRMFNTGDVYSAMAQHFYGDELPEEDRHLTGDEFKEKHRDLRNRMKTCTLGILYGMTPHGLVKDLGISLLTAEVLHGKFMGMFPALQGKQERAAQLGSIRGYASTMTGMRRRRGEHAGRWKERNWIINHPVQGSAAVVFKAAGNRLDKLYQRLGAKIIIPLHDAFIFEAPMEYFEEAANLTARVMSDTLQEYFPCLEGKVEVNTSLPTSWNKDGRNDALEVWITDIQEMLRKPA